MDAWVLTWVKCLNGISKGLQRRTGQSTEDGGCSTPMYYLLACRSEMCNVDVKTQGARGAKKQKLGLLKTEV